MNVVTVPSIVYKGKELKPEKKFDISDWVNNSGNYNSENFGFEAEGFMIDVDGSPLAFSDNIFHKIPNTSKRIDKISAYNTGEVEINNQIGNLSEVFSSKIARITQELYMPSIEISLDKGYNPGKLIEIALLSLKGVDDLAKSQGGYFLPIGNLPENTENIPNYANEYYKYLFDERDGHDISNFRGAGLQLHKGIDDKNLAVYVFNKIRHLLPTFLAISGNSPLDRGTYRGNISERTSTKSAWKMVGIPDAIDENFYMHLQKWLDTTIKSVTPYYYAVRYPRVDIRTIENCSMDMVHDIGIMIMIMDIYYRATEKLRNHYISGDPLPQNIFGQDTNCMIETNVMRENFHRAIRKGTKTNLSILGNKNDTEFSLYINYILEWIESVPSIFPENIKISLGIPSNTDGTKHIVNKIIRLGNLGEQSIRDLGLKNTTNGGRSIHIPKTRIREYSIGIGKHFRQQVNSILP